MGLRTYLGLKRPAPSSRRPRIGIVAPVKDEAPFLLEWIAYHRALGVEHFLIGDNGGDDGTSELLQALAAAGVIRRTDWLGVRALQKSFYETSIPLMVDLVDVVAMIDADEFLRPLNGLDNIPEAIAEIFARPEAAAASLHWASYGSSGRDEPGEGLVIERFTYRAPEANILNRFYKTVVRPECFGGVIAHKVRLTDGEYVNDLGVANHLSPLTEAVLANSVNWNRLRVDHFVVKSRAEFAAKRRRGRASTIDGIHHDRFFEERDRNEVFDPMPADFIARTKAEIKLLAELLDAPSATAF